jgi:Tol biopolymer transport system component
MSESGYCPYCGQPHAAEDAFCPYCGRSLAEAAEAAVGPDEQATVLAIPRRDPEETSLPDPDPTIVAPPRHEQPRPEPRGARARRLSLPGGPAPWIIGGAVGAAMVIGVVGWMLLGPAVAALNPFTVRDRIFIAEPNRAGESNLIVVRLGQPIRDAQVLHEDAVAAEQVSLYWGTRREFVTGVGLYGDRFGGFAPNRDEILFSYLDDGDAVVSRWAFNSNEPEVLLNSNSAWVSGQIVGDDLWLYERLNWNPNNIASEEWRCYVSRAGARADRLAKANSCLLSDDAQTMLLVERSEDLTTVKHLDVRTGDDAPLLEDEEYVALVDLAPDSSLMAYSTNEPQDARVIVLNAADGERVDRSPKHDSVDQLRFANGGHRFAVVASDDFEQSLYLSDDLGTPLATASQIRNVFFTPDDAQLACVLIDEDGQSTFWLQPVNGQEAQEILSAEMITVNATKDPGVLWIYAGEDDEVTVYSAALDGSRLTELYQEGGYVNFWTYHVVGQQRLLGRGERDDATIQLVLLDPGLGEPVILIEDWAEVGPPMYAPDGRTIAFVGREDSGDDEILYSLALDQGAEPVELDNDADGFRSFAFTSDGRAIVYTAVTGSQVRDVEIRSVAPDGQSDYDILYDGLALIDVQWETVRVEGAGFISLR